MTNEKTTGALDLEARAKAPDSASVKEIIDHFAPKYEDARNRAFEEGKKKYPQIDFFLEGELRDEKIYERVLPRILWFVRLTPPRPFFDQIVYQYTWKNDHLKELWVIPDGVTYNTYILNALMVDPSERELRDYCLAFKSGELNRLSERLTEELVANAE